MKAYRGVDVQRHTILTSAVDGGQLYRREGAAGAHWVGVWVGKVLMGFMPKWTSGFSIWCRKRDGMQTIATATFYVLFTVHLDIIV